MRLVVDTNISVAQLTRKRGRELIIHPSLELYMAQMAWEETCHEFSKRIEKMVRKGVFSQEVGQNLLNDGIIIAETKVTVIPHEIYASWDIARLHIPRDPNDWFTSPWL